MKRCIAKEGFENQVRFGVADARDLSGIPGKEFDAVLLMGPLYHLIQESDRILALKEASERLRTGGILFSAFLSRMGVFGDLIKRLPAWIENQAEVRSILAKGRRPDNAPPGGFRAYFAPVSEIAPLHETLGYETIALAGVDTTVLGDDESYNRLEGIQRELWLDLFEEISTEKSILGSSRHLLYIGRKK
jgi:S-adenosylmethionine-dependent methyltransferase